MMTQTVIASEAKQPSLRKALDCRVAALLAMTLAISGCSDENGSAIEACRDFVKGGLRSPSTYEEVSSSVSDGEDVGQHDRRNVFIEYDAANAFGTPVRSTQLCSFEIDKATRKLVRDASTSGTLAKADRVLGRGDGSCCVPYREPVPGAADSNITMDELNPHMNEAAE